MSAFEDYIELLREFGINNINRLEDVKCLQAQAMGYIWGWQDSHKERDDRVSEEFAYAYGVHAANFALERITHRMPIQDAFQSFLKTGEIRKYGEY